MFVCAAARAGLVTNIEHHASRITPGVTNLGLQIVFNDTKTNQKVLYILHSFTISAAANGGIIPTAFDLVDGTTINSYANMGWCVVVPALRGRETETNGIQDLSGHGETHDVDDADYFMMTNAYYGRFIDKTYRVVQGQSAGGNLSFNTICKLPGRFNWVNEYSGMICFSNWYPQNPGVQTYLRADIGGASDDAALHMPAKYDSRDGDHAINTLLIWGYLLAMQNTSDDVVPFLQTLQLSNAVNGNPRFGIVYWTDPANPHGSPVTGGLPVYGFSTWAPLMSNSICGTVPPWPESGTMTNIGEVKTPRFEILYGGGTNGIFKTVWNLTNRTYTITPVTADVLPIVVRLSVDGFTNIASISDAVTFTNGFLTPPGNLQLDASDFFDDGYKQSIAVQLRWDDTPDNNGYVVQVSTNSVDFYDYATIAAHNSAFDNLLVPWTSNRWTRVRAISGSTNSSYSATLHVHGASPATHLNVTTSVTNVVRLSWVSAGSDGVTGYWMEQDTNALFDSPDFKRYWVDNIDSTLGFITNNFALNRVYYFRSRSATAFGVAEPMNKPYAYKAVAPNGPPTAPILGAVWTLATSTNSQTSTSVRFAFTETAPNLFNELVEISTDSNVWTKVPFTRSDQAGQAANVANLAPNTLYYLRSASTNALGTSAPVVVQITMPGVAAAGVTNWYVSTPDASGNGSGTNWANPWKGLHSMNWYRLGAGHTVYIDGGTSGKTYESVFETSADGTQVNPVTIRVSREASHNGHVTQHGHAVTRSRWITLDGSESDTAAAFSPEIATNNIGWTIKGLGDLGGFDAALNTPTAIGARFRYIECTGVGNPNSADSVVAVNLAPEGADGCLSVVAEALWVHDVWASAFVQGCALGYGIDVFSSAVITNCVAERFRNNGIVVSRSLDVDNSIIRETEYPAVAHPDGVQGGISNVRLRNSVFQNCNGHSGSTFYPNLDVGLYHDLYIINCLFTETDTNQASGVNFQYSMLGAGSVTFSNIWYIGNTFYGLLNVSIGIGGSTAFAATCRTKNSGVINNLFFSGALASSGAGIFGVGYTNDTFADIVVDRNIFCGPQKIIQFYNSYESVPAFNAASGFLNQSNTPSVVSVAGLNFNLYGSDTVAKDGGTNLISSSLPFVLGDINGFAHGSGSGWDIGAYEFDASLKFWADFEQTVTNGGVWNFKDMSGSAAHPLRWGNPTTQTNYPSVGTDRGGGQAALFTEYQDTLINVGGNTTQYHTGDYMGATNIAAIANLTDATFATWVYLSNPNQDDQTLLGGGGANDPGEYVWLTLDGFLKFGLVLNGAMDLDHVLGADISTRSNEWIHVAVTYQSGTTSILTAYLNGVAVMTNTGSGVGGLAVVTNVTALKIATNNTGMVFGCWSFDNDLYRNQVSEGGNDDTPDNGWLATGSMLDDFRIYNRVLTAGQVAALANGGVGGSSPPAAPETSCTVTSTNTAQFATLYDDGLTVTLTAPTTFTGGYTFSKWQMGGVDYSTDVAIDVVVSSNTAVSAIYTTTGGSPSTSAPKVRVKVR